MKNKDIGQIPSSLYRLQLNADFPLKRAVEVLPYLVDLGVEGVYCSPFYDAYSDHGYDVTNPNTINPKIGSLEEYETFCRELKVHGLKQIVDVVPNHMGMRGGKNMWWQDVLEKGASSTFARYFDIDWNPEKLELKNRVLLPILGAHYGTVLKNQEITLREKEGKYWLEYADYPLPVAPETYHLITPEMDVEALDRLLEAQHYRLAYWRVASHEINYRRFFNIHELVALRIEEPGVLDAHHKWLFELIEKGVIDGLRIDHPDGLYDPPRYFADLHSRYPIYTVVEKILDRNESLPTDWQVEGTVGYEYLNVLSGLFIQKKHGKAFDALYEEVLGEKIDFEECVYASKKLFASHEMVSEVEGLGRLLDRLSETDRDYRDFTRVDLTEALGEVIACFPVYRTYVGPEGEVSKRDSAYLSVAIEKAQKKAPHLDPSLFDFLEKVLHAHLGEAFRPFILRFQQLTAPIMAKGLEDTSFYRYNRFISLNEVGGDPLHFGYAVEDFHRFNQMKHQKWPYGFLTTSTHDTKRSEDVRMRLNVLSEMPEEWAREVKLWREIAPFESPNTQYMLFQTLVGAWPLSFERLWEVMLKSVREAKEETSWMFPNHVFEGKLRSYVERLISSEPFLERFLPFQEEVARLGALNSLSSSALKLGSCGVVDIYQGNEHLHFCLVDPDNRRPVDFGEFDHTDLKAWVYKKALHFRKAHRELFLEGEYHPLKVEGEHTVAFMRTYGEEVLIVIAGRFFTSWEAEEVVLPKEWQGITFHELFTEKEVEAYRTLKTSSTLPIGYFYGKRRHTT